MPDVRRLRGRPVQEARPERPSRPDRQPDPQVRKYDALTSMSQRFFTISQVFLLETPSFSIENVFMVT